MKLLCFICVIWIVYLLVMLYKNHVTYRNLTIIGKAILLYNLHQIETGSYKQAGFMDYCEIKDYYKVLFDHFNWGYKNLLPPDKYALVEPYIDAAIIEAKKEGWIK